MVQQGLRCSKFTFLWSMAMMLNWPDYLLFLCTSPAVNRLDLFHNIISDFINSKCLPLRCEHSIEYLNYSFSNFLFPPWPKPEHETSTYVNFLFHYLSYKTQGNAPDILHCTCLDLFSFWHQKSKAPPRPCKKGIYNLSCPKVATDSNKKNNYTNELYIFLTNRVYVFAYFASGFFLSILRSSSKQSKQKIKIQTLQLKNENFTPFFNQKLSHSNATGKKKH